MKVNRRSSTLDMLSLHHKGYSLAVYTHRNKIWVRVEKGGECIDSREYSPARFIANLLAMADGSGEAK